MTGYPTADFVTGRDLYRPPSRTVSRLHIERPVQVSRLADGHWGWQCSLCPLPLCLVTTPTGTWTAAMEEAAAHLGSRHGATRSAGPEQRIDDAA